MAMLGVAACVPLDGITTPPPPATAGVPISLQWGTRGTLAISRDVVVVTSREGRTLLTPSVSGPEMPGNTLRCAQGSPTARSELVAWP